MSENAQEIARRTEAALVAIRAAFGTPQDEHDTTLFVSHHLEEITGTYWQRPLGVSQPTPTQILDILELRSHWSDEDDDGIATFDFTLSESVTNYVISVCFDESGQIEAISMES